MCLFNLHHLPTPLFYRVPAVCEKTFSASFVPQPAENTTLVIYFSVYQIYNNCYSLARVWAACGFRSILSTNTVGVSIFGQDFNKRSTTKSLNDYAGADLTLHTTSHRLRIHKDDACTTIPLSCMVFNKSLNKDKNQFSSVV